MLPILEEYEKLKVYNAVVATRQGKEIVFDFSYCDPYTGERTKAKREVVRIDTLQSVRVSDMEEIVSLNARKQELNKEIAVLDAIAADIQGGND